MDFNYKAINRTASQFSYLLIHMVLLYREIIEKKRKCKAWTDLNKSTEYRKKCIYSIKNR